MILQCLDIRDNCKGIYHNNKIILDPPKELLKQYTVCWKYSQILDQDEKYTFLFLILKDENLCDYSDYPEKLSSVISNLQAQQRAAISAKIDMSEICFFDLIPTHKLETYFQLTDNALRNLSKTKTISCDYDILHKAHVLTTKISNQKIQYKNEDKKIYYNIFGSSTGRLTTKSNSFPILNLKKENRLFLKPQNDAFVEFDFNAAEVRMLLALSGHPQPREDIHEYLKAKIFTSDISRSEFKERLFAWLYNPISEDNIFDSFFDKKTYRDFFTAEGQILKTPFGRRIKVEERKAQNYLLQSTTSDQVIENAYEIQKILNNKKSSVAFTLHDSIILDMAKEDAIMLRKIKQQFEKTRWGDFMSTCKIGKNFGSLREMKF